MKYSISSAVNKENKFNVKMWLPQIYLKTSDELQPVTLRKEANGATAVATLYTGQQNYGSGGDT